MPLPDFIICGFNRSGTSTLHALLERHPDICMSRPKELHVYNYDTNYARRERIYSQAFAHCNNGPVKGEATPSYIYNGIVFENDLASYYYAPDNDSIQRLARDAPGTRLIISLRNPVSMAQSNFNKAQLEGREPADMTFMQALTEEWTGKRTIQQTFLCHYYLTRQALHVRHVLDYFPRENVYFLIFEEWTRHQQATLDQLAKWLGATGEAPFIDDELVKNTGRAPIAPALRKWAGALLPRKLGRRILRRLGTHKDGHSLGVADYERAMEACHADIAELETLTGLELHHIWTAQHHAG